MTQLNRLERYEERRLLAKQTPDPCECGPHVIEGLEGHCYVCGHAVEHEAAPAWMVALTLALIVIVVSLSALAVVGAV